jgi:predicted NAD/FAD-dependent oxidoreductase
VLASTSVVNPCLGGCIAGGYSKPVALHSELCSSLRIPAPIAFAGDGFGGARIEGAYRSGLQAAQEVEKG